MSSKVLKGRTIYGGIVSGEAIVTKERLSFYGGVDPESGIVTEKGHELYGKKLKGKILFLPSLKGSAAAVWVIERLSRNSCAPLAIVVEKSDAILVGGVILGKILTVDCIFYTGLINTDQKVRVNGEKGFIELLNS